jgi:hypothetical protein
MWLGLGAGSEKSRKLVCDGRSDLVSLSNEWAVNQEQASKDVNTEAEEATTFEAVTRRQPMKIQQTEKN